MRTLHGIACLSLLLAACATVVQVGRDFDPGAFEAKAQRGVTTQAEVRSWLGAPNGAGISVESNGDRFEKWTYYYGEGQLPGLAGATIKILEIKFDAQHIVRAYQWSGAAKQ